MVKIDVDKILGKDESYYSFVLGVAKRAREIIGGAMPLIDTKETKPLSIAIEEINRGLITYSRNEDDEIVE